VERGDEIPDLADDLVRREVDVIVAANTQVAQSVKQVTETIPIVFVEAGDPVGSALIDSLARPGGNITGLANLSPQLSAKGLQLLKASTIPGTSRAAVLWNPTSPDTLLDFRETREAARTLGLRLESLEVRGPDDLTRAFQTAVDHGTELLVALGDTLIGLYAAAVVGLAARSRLPAIYNKRLFVEAGGLMAYGPSTVESWRRAATYVDKILKGARPADLPVEQPTTFDLVINLKTAQALGLTIPQSVLVQATQVLQ
jgi:putative ABC transport system substrate-binding protein